jgi:hypothetical protein
MKVGIMICRDICSKVGKGYVDRSALVEGAEGDGDVEFGVAAIGLGFLRGAGGEG